MFFLLLIPSTHCSILCREKSEERRNGDVCNSTCYNVLHNADLLDPQGVAVVIKLCCHWTPEPVLHSSRMQ
ncbi:hypothetical protein D5086_005328 [Populus alba]|uniref:Uncharacterized protein n=1 Tax=Populus alba TaxID=43335 RepID=A0ACC4CV12_POPAL